MRILLTTVSGYGHLHPLVPLALAASAAGDEVRIAVGPDLVDWVAACGLEPITAGRGAGRTWTAAEQARLAQHGPTRAYHLFTTFLVPPMLEDLLAACRVWRPDLVVHEETEFAGPLLARLLDVPCVTHSYAAPAKPAEERATMVELLEPIWAEHGATGPRTTGDLYLDACPPAFQTAAVEVVPEVRAVRPVGFDGPPADPPPWLAGLARPAAYLTLGTVAAFSTVEVLQRGVDALRDVVPGLVVTTGPNPANALEVGDGVVVEAYLRQSLVLGDVDVVVSHGGAGTTLGAIEHGLPHVVVPQQPYSQRRNAERVEALGLGRHVPQGAEHRVGAAVREVLADGAFAERTGAMRAALDRLPSPAEVVPLLRGLV